MLTYSWPGNVRELEHTIERAVLLTDGPMLTVELPPPERPAGGEQPEGQPLVSLEVMERQYIETVLRHTRGVIAGKGGAAEILRIAPSTLRSRMKKLGMS